MIIDVWCGHTISQEVAVMFNRCPGVERSIRIELYKCPKCGAEVEIFSNEVKVKCYGCGERWSTVRDCLPASTGALRRGSVWGRRGGGS